MLRRRLVPSKGICGDMHCDCLYSLINTNNFYSNTVALVKELQLDLELISH